MVGHTHTEKKRSQLLGCASYLDPEVCCDPLGFGSGLFCGRVFSCPDHVESCLSTAVLRPKLSTSEHQAIQAYGVFEQKHISMHMILVSDDDALTTMCRRRRGWDSQQNGHFN